MFSKQTIINGKKYKYRKVYKGMTIYSTQSIGIKKDRGVDIGGDRVFDPLILQIGDLYFEAWSSEWGAIDQISVKD